MGNDLGGFDFGLLKLDLLIGLIQQRLSSSIILVISLFISFLCARHHLGYHDIKRCLLISSDASIALDDDAPFLCALAFLCPIGQPTEALEDAVLGLFTRVVSIKP
jgi:hypothetical protein